MLLGRGTHFCSTAIDSWELYISNSKNGEKMPEKSEKNQEKNQGGRVHMPEASITLFHQKYYQNPQHLEK